MRLTSNVGTILLAIFLILTALTLFGLPIPAILTGIVAIIAGILLLVGR